MRQKSPIYTIERLRFEKFFRGLSGIPRTPVKKGREDTRRQRRGREGEEGEGEGWKGRKEGRREESGAPSLQAI
jgi:hypothetical protein